MTTEIPLRVTSEEDQIAPNSTVLLPLTQILPIIRIYLHDFNSVLPLFDAGTLLRLVHSHYTVGPSQHDPVVWAVLALAQRHDIAASHDIPSSAVCLRSAESVMSKAVLGDNLESARRCSQAMQQVMVGIIIFVFKSLRGYNLITAQFLLLSSVHHGPSYHPQVFHPERPLSPSVNPVSAFSSFSYPF